MAFNERKDFAFGSSMTAVTVKGYLLFNITVCPMTCAVPNNRIASNSTNTNDMGFAKASFKFPETGL